VVVVVNEVARAVEVVDGVRGPAPHHLPSCLRRVGVAEVRQRLDGRRRPRRRQLVIVDDTRGLDDFAREIRRALSLPGVHRGAVGSVDERRRPQHADDQDHRRHHHLDDGEASFLLQGVEARIQRTGQES